MGGRVIPERVRPLVGMAGRPGRGGHGQRRTLERRWPTPEAFAGAMVRRPDRPGPEPAGGTTLAPARPDARPRRRRPRPDGPHRPGGLHPQGGATSSRRARAWSRASSTAPPCGPCAARSGCRGGTPSATACAPPARRSPSPWGGRSRPAERPAADRPVPAPRPLATVRHTDRPWPAAGRPKGARWHRSASTASPSASATPPRSTT